MKIVQVNNYGFVRGGSDRYFIDVAELLREHGHSVSELVTRDPRNVVSTPWQVNGFCPESPGAKDLGGFFYSRQAGKVARRIARAFKPDLVHLHIYYGQLTPSILNAFRAESIPIVQTLHEYKLFCPVATMTRNQQFCDACSSGSFWKAAYYRCKQGSLSRSMVTSLEAYTSRWLGDIRKVDHFIAVSDFVRRTMIHFGIPETRISTVHNFIQTDAFSPSYKAGEYFVYFGRIEEIKGIRTLLTAMQHVDAELLVIGEGSYRAAAEQESKDKKLRVRFLGYKKGEELHRLIRDSLCVVVPSEWNETFGLVILEANALGRPVVASRIGGMQEVVENGETGLLFEAGNAADLAAKMNRILADPAQAVEMGRRGNTLARDGFGKENHYQRLMNVYRKLV